jgi:hypothetical protein
MCVKNSGYLLADVEMDEEKVETLLRLLYKFFDVSIISYTLIHVYLYEWSSPRGGSLKR